MTTPDSDDRFWEAARYVRDTPGSIPSDEVLNAYRAGRLTAERRREIEGLLASNAAARQRLIELGGTIAASPSARVREALLDTGRGDTTRRRTVPRSAWGYWSAAAAVLVAATLLTARFGPWAPTDERPVVVAALDSGLTFDIQVSALADRRSEASRAVALPGSTVRVVMQQQGDARPGLEFGLYRLANGKLRRLSESDGLSAQLGRGAVDWRVPASSLVDTTPGRHPFYLAVGPHGSLPPDLTPDGRSRLEAQLAAACRGLAYESTLEIQISAQPEGE